MRDGWLKARVREHWRKEEGEQSRQVVELIEELARRGYVVSRGPRGGCQIKTNREALDGFSLALGQALLIPDNDPRLKGRK